MAEGVDRNAELISWGGQKVGLTCLKPSGQASGLLGSLTEGRHPINI